jgi:hypothetical protein
MQGMDIWLQSFLTSGLCGSEYPASRPGSGNNPQYSFNMRICGPGAILRILEAAESLALAAIPTPGYSSP